ncbi:tRNA (adenosine(37)-N6)-dimethylallyltransferase MiaA [Bacillus capparidis]|uniref:tRNA dimethylallyltransferase n=1 Tax=Bacillus capparidis TaxID=1840411 RepID=A0ABS4CRD8_9BACI|nr:tRNA (adenosine(37)-N6)-dimethylallyltransferase MiaA [Bacillus capparidis]MBP1080101.1 tRNA dimethylallyltransferase [Bacillus capparidis]MED1095487.1 tRNA (adenosine(37)-N6)-dimethylallyltransferase MiaA [Bacillus capparidis]
MAGKEKVAVLIGPTAVGKTNLSVQLADMLDAEIISGDSMQVYKQMNIGTAKITAEEMQGISHHLIDIKEPCESFSAAEFQELARKKISEISSRGKLPMIVGGTGLYIEAVLSDYSFTVESGDPLFRKNLEKTAQEKGNMYLYHLLAERDPESAKNIHPNNVRRVVRALEVLHTTGRTKTDQTANQKSGYLYDTALVGLTMEREQLYDRINRRVDQMMVDGLLEEVRGFYQDGLTNCQSIQAIGYKEFYTYLDGDISIEEAVAALKQNSRRYAKRQLTWFRNKMEVQWFDMSDPLDFEKKKHEIFSYIAGKLKF